MLCLDCIEKDKLERREGSEVWPCPTCGATDFEDAGNKCKADPDVCAADDQREMDAETAMRLPKRERQEGGA
jgi:hypothetical protein